uniref:CHCH domain-containing protein n=1 Tax=Picea sitchensis TaxID=3332 RepID=B8LQJ9_PICSI|nr:unknown [Picea sitchensis]
MASSPSQSRYQSPPYPSASKLSDSMCYAAYAASLKCLDDSNYDKSKCQDQFYTYKECRKKEREIRLEQNRHKSFFS